ncbi:MAG: YceD family protein [Alphaproteobacteria bacterium]
MPSLEPREVEFSRVVNVGALGETELIREIAAGIEERVALAKRFGLVSIGCLSAAFRLKRVGDGTFSLTCRLRADVVQECVVSLAPVEACIEESFAATYVRSSVSTGERVVSLSVEANDPPEAITSDEIDVGEAVAQQLGVLLEPYPRAPGASIDHLAPNEPGSAPAEGPFAALAELKRRLR